MSLQTFALTDRVALVTGASSGLGHGIAKGLAEAGATVVACARRAERLEQLVGEIRAAGGQTIAVSMDVTDRASVDAGFAAAREQVGVPTVIVNNAGMAAPKSFLKADEAGRDQVMNANVNGVWNVAQEGARQMVAAQLPGSIINIASVLGLMVQHGQASYCASKGAVIQLSNVMALELLRHNIRVNAIAPGWFRTEMNADFFDTAEGQAYIERMPARRLGRIEELLGPVLLLASEAGSFITGTVLPVDGAIRLGAA